jgi:hypothetical protein
MTLKRLFEVGSRINPLFFWGRVFLYGFLVIWGIRFLLGHADHDVVLLSFMHNVNLPIHEAGHMVFRFFGDFMGVLGGSIMQLLIPAVFVVAFIYQQKNPFGGAISLWWLAQNFMDLAPYIGDARVQRLVLLGGVTGREAPGYHDWNNILGRLGWLQHDEAIAAASYDIGRLLMVAMFVWGGYLLLLQYRVMKHGPPVEVDDSEDPFQRARRQKAPFEP